MKQHKRPYFNNKDLDVLLWEWAASVLHDHDSGYPSDYTLRQRVDSGQVFVPDYFPKPRIARINIAIGELEDELKNTIVCRYLFNMKIPEIAQTNGCHNATVYRKLNSARDILLDEMRMFARINTKIEK